MTASPVPVPSASAAVPPSRACRHLLAQALALAAGVYLVALAIEYGGWRIVWRTMPHGRALPGLSSLLGNPAFYLGGLRTCALALAFGATLPAALLVIPSLRRNWRRWFFAQWAVGAGCVLALLAVLLALAP